MPMMTIVPLARNHTIGADDAKTLEQAVNAYSKHFSEGFTDAWSNALGAYDEERKPIDLFESGTNAPEGSVPLEDNNSDLDDVHYLNFAIDTFRSGFSNAFTSAWELAFQRYRQNRLAITFSEGEIVDTEDAPEPPALEVDTPEPPLPNAQEGGPTPEEEEARIEEEQKAHEMRVAEAEKEDD